METKLLIVLLVVFTLSLLAYVVWKLVKGAKVLFYKNHVIVAGLSRIGAQVAFNLAKEGRKVVVITSGSPGPDAAIIREHGGIVLHGAGYDEQVLREAGLASASTVFVATGKDESNIQLAQFISRLKKRRYGRSPLKIMVHVEDYDLKNMVADYLNAEGQGMCDVQPFNMEDITAQLVYDTFPPHAYLTDETERDNEKIICIVGNTPEARSFLVENSILSQYSEKERLKVFLVSPESDAFLKSIIRRHSHIQDFLNIIAVEQVNNHFSTKQAWDERFVSAIPSIDAVYFFGDNDAKLVNTAIHMRQFIYEKTQNIRKVPLIVCLPEETRVVNMLDGEVTASGKQSLGEKFKEQTLIHLVRKYTDTCSVARMIDGSHDTEVIAKAINYYYSIKYEFDGLLYTHFKKSGNQDFINRLERNILEFKVKRGDPLSQLEQMVVDFTKEYTKNSAEKIKSVFGVNRLWNNLTDRKKESNRYVARHIDVKLHILKNAGIKKFTKEEFMANLKKLAPIEHTRWCAEKLAFNFRYGKLPASDKNLKNILKDTLKIHDQLIPYHKLDDTNKEKDLDMFFLLPLLLKIKENIKE